MNLLTAEIKLTETKVQTKAVLQMWQIERCTVVFTWLLTQYVAENMHACRGVGNIFLSCKLYVYRLAIIHVLKESKPRSPSWRMPSSSSLSAGET